MKPSALLPLAVGTISAALLSTASADPKVTSISGDKDAVWLVTENNRLIYCWWPQDPSRPESRAQCKVVERFDLDRLK